MNPIQIFFATISALGLASSLVVAAYNAYTRLSVKNEILQLRIYVTDNYVQKPEMTEVRGQIEKVHSAVKESSDRVWRKLNTLQRVIDRRFGNVQEEIPDLES